jgi:adenosylcobinamide-GDP ribazoletransferase
MSFFRKFAMAASYVTILPLACLVKEKEKKAKQAQKDDTKDQTSKTGPETEELSDLDGLAKYLPAVGALLGAILALSAMAITLLTHSSLLTAAIIAVEWLILTGGLHFDGLMDTADGIFSHRSRERMLEIMQDSRVGNMAVMAGTSIFVLKVAALSTFPAEVLPVLLVLSPALARLSETFAIAAYPYARAEGKGKIWHDSTRFPADVLAAAVIPLALVAAFSYLLGAVAITVVYLLISLAVGWAASYYFATRLGGHTGDTYGAVVEVTETISLVIFSLMAATR